MEIVSVIVSIILSVGIGGIVLRIFPKLVSAGLVRHIDHKYNTRIEQLKGYFAGTQFVAEISG